MFELLLWSLLGAVGAAFLALVPALHIYNVAGFLILLSGRLDNFLTPEQIAFLFLGMITSYAMLNTIPSIFLSAPDDSTVFMVLPGQKYLLQQRGYEAVVLSSIGSLGGLAALLLLTPVATHSLPLLREILRPHMTWILWTVIAYMLLSEWPKGTGRQAAGWARWWDGWKSLTAGLDRSLLPVEVAYQNLLPVFVGLFAVPWVIQNLLARIELPPQHISRTVDAPASAIFQGTAAGVMGGLFAAFFPVVTGGIGGFLAGHATAQRDERAFIISQGASKIVYYVGGFLFFFVPGLHLTRGGMAWMISTQYSAYTPERYYWATAAVLLTGVVAFFLSLIFTRIVIAITARVSYRHISRVTLGLLLLVVFGMTGLAGLAVCAVATGIGLIPVLWGSRRMNAMGVLLLPIALNMAGAGDSVARLLGLL